MISIINSDDEFLCKLWMSDEAHFHLTGYVNKQNYYRVSHKKVYFKNFCNAKTCKDKAMKVSPCINNVLEICLPSKSSLSILLS